MPALDTCFWHTKSDNETWWLCSVVLADRVFRAERACGRRYLQSFQSVHILMSLNFIWSYLSRRTRCWNMIKDIIVFRHYCLKCDKTCQFVPHFTVQWWTYIIKACNVCESCHCKHQRAQDFSRGETFRRLATYSNSVEAGRKFRRKWTWIRFIYMIVPRFT